MTKANKLNDEEAAGIIKPKIEAEQRIWVALCLYGLDSLAMAARC